MYKKIIFPLLFLGFAGFANAQLPKGDRILAWEIGMAQNNDYDSAFAYADRACMESVHLFFTWATLEPDTSDYDSTLINAYLDVANIYYPAFGMSAELQIAPINTNVLETPSVLTSVSFDDPLMINQFKRFLDTVFTHIPDLELTALNIGNESDAFLGSDPASYNEFKVFLDSVAPYAQQLYYDIHGTNLKVGTTFTYGGLTNASTSALCQNVNTSRDIISVTYYPLNSDFTMKPPSAIPSDFGTLVGIYPDTAKPIYMVECGYASSPICNSSEALQAQFYTEVFNGWDTYYDNIKLLSIFMSTDWSKDEVDTLGSYYGITDTIFLEYLRTLGVRTWPGNGTDKMAYKQIQCELETRGWCSVTCPSVSIEDPIDLGSVRTYPNPARQSFTLEYENPSGLPCTLTLYDLQGRKVRSINEIRTGEITLKRNGLDSGIYFYRLSMDGREYNTGKVLFE